MEKKEAWDFALGLIKVDGLEPSNELLELMEKEINGEITKEQIIELLHKKYSELSQKK